MKKLILIVLSSVVAAQGFAAELVVNQEYTTPYYAEFVAPVHAKTAFRFFNDELHKYDCLQVEARGEITKKARTRIFGRDTPGEYTMAVQTKCFSNDLKSVRFHVGSIGYDEDYTQVVLELKTKTKGTLYPQICVYGLDGDVRNCPQGMFERPTDFSKVAN